MLAGTATTVAVAAADKTIENAASFTDRTVVPDWMPEVEKTYIPGRRACIPLTLEMVAPRAVVPLKASKLTLLPLVRALLFSVI